MRTPRIGLRAARLPIVGSVTSGARRYVPTHGGAAGLLALGVLCLLWPVLLGGRALSPASLLYFIPPWAGAGPADIQSFFNPVLSDVPTAYYPWWSYARETLRSGAFPEWNPFALGGTPFLANPQTALLSPFSLVLWTLPLNYALGALAAVQLWLTGFGTYLFARRLGLSFAPGLLAGVAFGFSAFAIVWMTYPLLSVFALLPWALWLVERILDHGRGGDALALGLVLLGALLAGHPGSQIHLYTVVGLYTVLRLILLARPPLRERLRRGSLVGVSLIVGLAGAAIVLLPTALAIPGTVGVEARSSGALILPDPAMRTLLFPDWWGRPSELYLAAPFNFNEGTIYAGTIALILAALALITPGRWREKAPLALLGIVGFQAAFALDPTGALLEHTPVLENNRNARLSVLVQLSAALLAAIGLQQLLDRAAGRWRIAIVCVGAGAVGAAGLVAADPSFHDLRVTGNHFRTGTDYAIPDVIQTTAVGWWILLAAGLAACAAARRRMPAGVLGALVLLLAAFDAGHFARDYNPMPPDGLAFPAPPPAVEFLREKAGTERVVGLGTTLPPDTSTVYRLRDIRGNDPPMPTLRYMRLFRLINPAQGTGDWLAVPALDERGKRVLDALNARWILIPPGWPPPAVPGLQPALNAGDVVVYRNTTAVPRAYIPRSVRPVASESDALEEIQRRSFDARSLAVVEEARPTAARGTVRVVRDHPDEIVLSARLTRGGLVVVPDTFDEGWRVSVDGEAADPIRTNSVQRGVVVPTGAHEVRWTYRTPGLTAGAAVSAATLILLAAWAVLLARRSRRQPIAARRRREGGATPSSAIASASDSRNASRE